MICYEISLIGDYECAEKEAVVPPSVDIQNHDEKMA